MAGGQVDRDGDVGFDRECLLGQRAVAAQPGECDRGGGVGRVQPADRATEGVVDVGHHRRVEVHTAEVLDAQRVPEHLEALRADPYRRDVEGAAAEVVDDHRVAGDEVAGGVVVRRSGSRLGHHLRAGHPGQLRHLGELLAPVGPPHRGVGEHHVDRRLALHRGDGPDDVRELGGEQLGRPVLLVAEDQRGRVAEPPLELPRALGLVLVGPAFGRVAADQLAPGADADHRRDHGRVIAEAGQLDSAGPAHRGRRESHAEVDTQAVRHGHSHGLESRQTGTRSARGATRRRFTGDSTGRCRASHLRTARRA